MIKILEIQKRLKFEPEKIKYDQLVRNIFSIMDPLHEEITIPQEIEPRVSIVTNKCRNF